MSGLVASSALNQWTRAVNAFSDLTDSLRVGSIGLQFAVAVSLGLLVGCSGTRDNSDDLSSAAPPLLSDDASIVPTESMWHFDFGVAGQPGMEIGGRTFYSFVRVGNLGSVPIRLDDVEFPELDDGLRITQVGLYPESEPELAPGEDPFPDIARPIDGSAVLEPTFGTVDDIQVATVDPRFYAVYVEVEVLTEGQWSIGPMDLTYTEAGETRRKRISNQVGDACTTPIDETCMPWAS